MTKTSPLAMIYQLGPIKTEWRLQTVEGGVIEDYGTLEQALVRCAGQGGPASVSVASLDLILWQPLTANSITSLHF